MRLLKPRRDLKRSRIWMIKTPLAPMYAHRGFHDKPIIPENSMPAFRRAVKRGWGVEFDVHLIKDGSLVIFHDDTLVRETGAPGVIEDLDLAGVKALRLEGTDEQIPTFDELLDLFENNPVDVEGSPYYGKPVPLLIELKTAGKNYKDLVEKVCRRLETYTGEYVIESFDPRAVLELKKKWPHITRGQLVQNFLTHDLDRAKAQSFMLTEMLFNHAAKPDFVSYRFADKDMHSLKRIHKNDNIAEAVWTVRSPKSFRLARKKGYTAIFEKFDPENMPEETKKSKAKKRSDRR